METFFLFLIVGLLAQAVDGALGMAYGVISTSVLLAFGVPPATASASVHGAEVFTTGASATSHISHRNVDWRLFAPLAGAGMVGGAAGAFVLTGVDGDVIKPFVIAYLAVMGGWILWRARKRREPKAARPAWITAPLGLIGGLFDAIGGGGWGPTVSSALMVSGQEARRVIGTVNSAEFLVTCTISATFVWALLTGRWSDVGALQDHAAAVGGLVAGGLVAAPFAGHIVKRVPHRALSRAVGGLLICLSIFQGLQLWGVTG